VQGAEAVLEGIALLRVVTGVSAFPGGEDYMRAANSCEEMLGELH